MKKVISILVPLSIIAALSGCSGQDDEKVADRARIEGKAQAEEQLKKDRELLEEQTRKQKELQDEQLRKQKELQDELVEKERQLQSEQIKKERGATDARAKEMEKSLAKLQDFYDDNSGVYEGTMKNGSDQFSVLITLAPSIPRYGDSRVRTPAEIETDLVNLTYQAQILQWIPPSKESAVGCSVTGLRPNTKKDTLTIISSDCPSTYQLTLNRTNITGTARRQNNPDNFDLYADRTSKPAPVPAKKTKKKSVN